MQIQILSNKKRRDSCAFSARSGVGGGEVHNSGNGGSAQSCRLVTMPNEEVKSPIENIEETKTVTMEGSNRSNGPNTLQSNEYYVSSKSGVRNSLIENGMDGWSDWYNLLKQTMDIIEEDMMN